MDNLEKDQRNSTKDSSTIELIYEEASSSVKFLRDDIGGLNARLGILLGFDAAFIRLSMDLPGQTSCIKLSAQAMNCYSCQWLKALALMAVMGSIAMILIGISPADVHSIFYPKSQINKFNEIKGNLNDLGTEQRIEDDFRKLVIESRDQTIREFLDVSDKKATALKRALILFGIAALLTALDLIIQGFYC